MPSTRITNCDKKIIFKRLGFSRLEEQDLLCTKITSDLSWGCALAMDYIRTIGEKKFCKQPNEKDLFFESLAHILGLDYDSKKTCTSNEIKDCIDYNSIVNVSYSSNLTITCNDGSKWKLEFPHGTIFKDSTIE